MTGDDLPTTPGSVATDDRGRRYAASLVYWGILRWVPLTHFERRPPDPDEFARRNPTVDFVAPAWADPGPPRIDVLPP